MDPTVLSQIVSSAGGIVGGLVGGIGSRRRAGRQFRHNKKLAEYSFDRQKEMWEYAFDKEAAYNSPLAQMGRMKEAGINPHMGFAGGSAQNTQTAGALPQYNQEANDVGPSGGEIFGGLIQNFLNHQMALTQLRKDKAQARQEEANADILEEGLSTKKRTEWERTQNEYNRTKQEGRMRYGDRGKGMLSRYEEGIDLDNQIKGLQTLVMKSQKALNEITASNLITNDQLVEIQTQVAKAQFDFLKTDWFKELPPSIKAVFMALASKMAGLK